MTGSNYSMQTPLKYCIILNPDRFVFGTTENTAEFADLNQNPTPKLSHSVWKLHYHPTNM